MFTGLVEAVGVVVALEAQRLVIRAPGLAADLPKGASVAVNGCCLTVADRAGDQLAFDLLEETLARTNLHGLRGASLVNLERALAANARLDGHFVQGHVDCTARILAFEAHGADHRLELELPREFAQYVAFKGSVAVDGISLTVAEVSPGAFAVWIIPHTAEQTNLKGARAGDLVNLEFDILAKYVERMLDRTAARL